MASLSKTIGQLFDLGFCTAVDKLRRTCAPPPRSCHFMFVHTIMVSYYIILRGFLSNN